jgi:3-deoxy-D-manno-octulosonic-acid transferase
MTAGGVPLAMRLYQAVAGPAFWALAQLRAAQGKEDRARLGERFGRASIARPPGRLVWFHGASVGETLAGIALWGALSARAPDLSALFTSGTRTSATVFAQRKPARAVHQFAPIDAPAAARRFMAHWAPDLGVFLEGELWPTLLERAQQAGTPLALANARMTARSLEGWRRRPALARLVLGRFAWIGAADRRTQAGLSQLLGRPVPELGNIKLAAPPPPINAPERAALGEALAGRDLWLAASTHAGEEAFALDAHKAVQEARPGALLILAPRHPERADDVESEARRRGFAVCRRSTRAPLSASTAVMLWDTMGELALAYALAPVAFVGGSLVDGVGGHNPVEPAQLGAAILSGRAVANFRDAFLALEEAGGVGFVTGQTLAANVLALLGDEAARCGRAAAAQAALADGGGALEATVEALCALLEPR